MHEYVKSLYYGEFHPPKYIPRYRVSEGKVFFFNLALRARNIQVRLYLKVVLKF